MTAFVLDASVLAALYVSDPASEASEAAMSRLRGGDLHAPGFVLLEVANVLWKRVRKQELPADAAVSAIGDLSSAAIDLHPTETLAPQALALALGHGFTAYDAAYVALALRLGGIVVTNDGGMQRRGVEAGLPIVGPEEVA